MSNMTPPSGYLVPEQPGSPARPGTVSLASTLLYLMAFLSLISAVLAIYQTTFMTQDKLEKVFKDGGYPTDQAEAAAAFTPIGLYAAAAFGILFAVLYVVLAIFVGKGKPWARITTWVLGGLAICCGAFGLLGTAAGSAFSGMGAPSGVDSNKVAEDTAALLPGWITPASTILGIVSLLAAILVVILLALPPSGPFFRKLEPVWTPPSNPMP